MQAKITEASVAEQVYILCFYESDIELSKDYTKSDQKKLNHSYIWKSSFEKIIFQDSNQILFEYGIASFWITKLLAIEFYNDFFYWHSL